MPKRVHKFVSTVLPDFYVVEERWGNFSYYPHTSQLPTLHQALEREFRAPLPQLVSRVGASSDEFWKEVRRMAVIKFCNGIHAQRSDGLLLFCLFDQNLAAHVAIAQQITEHTPSRGTTSIYVLRWPKPVSEHPNERKGRGILRPRIATIWRKGQRYTPENELPFPIPVLSWPKSGVDD